jgi:putative transposase
VYFLLRLNKRRKGKRRLPNHNPEPMAMPDMVNQCGSIDFRNYTLRDSRRFRTFNVLEDFNQEALAIEVELNLPTIGGYWIGLQKIGVVQRGSVNSRSS